MWCSSLHLLQEPDATRAQPRPQATVVQRSRTASTQLPAETRPSGKRPTTTLPLSSSYLKSYVVVIDINGRFECLRVAPRAAICPLEATNQFHVPLPLVIALLLPFPAISSCNLRAVLLADECLGGSSEAALVRRSKVLSPIGSPAQSGCVPVSRRATGAQPPTAARPASAVVVVAHVCSLEQIKQEVRGQPAAAGLRSASEKVPH